MDIATLRHTLRGQRDDSQGNQNQNGERPENLTRSMGFKRCILSNYAGANRQKSSVGGTVETHSFFLIVVACALSQSLRLGQYVPDKLGIRILMKSPRRLPGTAPAHHRAGIEPLRGRGT